METDSAMKVQMIQDEYGKDFAKEVGHDAIMHELSYKEI